MRVAVLMGGISSERDVSLRSGAAIAEALASRGHRISAVDITSDTLENHLRRESADIAFIALHGRFGEDGAVQKQCEGMGLPYTGSGPQASALALDKILSKRIFIECGLRTPEFASVSRGDQNPVRLGFPLAVKPPLEGSSIGLTIVQDRTDLPQALENAFRYGDSVLIESFVRGKELTVGILGGEALPVIQIVPKKGVYDYHAKYTAGQTEYLVPAPLDGVTARRIQADALKAFRVLGCEDFGRVDFILSEDGTAFVLEVNTIPGFTQTSLLPKAAGACGLDFASLCERILFFGMRKAEAARR